MAACKESSITLLCPFYATHQKAQINCRSVEKPKKNKTLKLMFKTSADRKAQQAKYCGTYNYKDCPHYKKLLSEYEKEHRYERTL